MIRYALRCDQGHDFDGWFRSAGGFDSLLAGGQVACTTCGSTGVSKAPMAPMVPQRAAARRPLTQPTPEERRLAALRDHIERTSDYVGDAFVAEARDMHAGVKPERPIHGEARIDEARKLLDEGIAVAPLPFRPRPKVN